MLKTKRVGITIKENMKLITIVFIVCIILINTISTKANEKSSQPITFSLCQAEFGTCPSTCTIKLIKGVTLTIGSYIKVFKGNTHVTEGYILKHISGHIYILKDKKEANDPDVCGGCCGAAYEIKISKKQIWGC